MTSKVFCKRSFYFWRKNFDLEQKIFLNESMILKFVIIFAF